MAKIKKPSIGLAVGKSTHTVVALNTDEGTTKMFVANSQAGLKKIINILQEREEKSIVLAGNRRFAVPLAYGLKQLGIKVFYYSLPTEREKRGKVGSIASKLPLVLQNQNLKLRPFFQESPHRTVNPEKLPSFRLAIEYGRKTKELQSIILQLYDHLAILFPEIVPIKKTSIRQGEKNISLPVPEPKSPGLFTIKMRPALQNPNPRVLEKMEEIPPSVKILAASSLAKYVPKTIYNETMHRYQRLLARYEQALEEKTMAIEALRQQVENHVLVKLFNDCDTIYVLLGFLGWRSWPHWREIRSFCGLDVTRTDKRGRAHISRKRPEIRRSLYLLATRTNKGKEITQGLKSKPHSKVKRIEKLLKFLWAEGLKEGITEQN